MQAPGPITLAAPHSGIAPHAYVIMRYTQQCECCGHVAESSKLFTKTRIRSSVTGALTNGNMMRICNEPPQYNLPTIVQNAEIEVLSICAHCPADAIAAHMATLPPVPDQDHLDDLHEAALLEKLNAMPTGVARRPYEEELQRFRARKARLLARNAEPKQRESTPRIRTAADLLAALKQ